MTNSTGEVTFIASDGIFADSLSSELVTPVGDPANGFTAAFQIAVAP
jgi:hypothetical protein